MSLGVGAIRPSPTGPRPPELMQPIELTAPWPLIASRGEGGAMSALPNLAAGVPLLHYRTHHAGVELHCRARGAAPARP